MTFITIPASAIPIQYLWRNQMPEFTQQQIEQSIKRAEGFIYSERRLSKVKSHNDSAPSLVDGFTENVGSHLGSLLGDSLAESLVPQARNIVTMREERESFLGNATLLGRLKTSLDDFAIGGFRVEKGDIEDTEKQLIASDDELIASFSSALEEGNTRAVFLALSLIVERAVQELVYTQLPPNAPPYNLSGL
jgi:hypothetical protein